MKRKFNLAFKHSRTKTSVFSRRRSYESYRVGIEVKGSKPKKQKIKMVYAHMKGVFLLKKYFSRDFKSICIYM